MCLQLLGGAVIEGAPSPLQLHFITHSGGNRGVAERDATKRNKTYQVSTKSEVHVIQRFRCLKMHHTS